MKLSKLLAASAAGAMASAFVLGGAANAANYLIGYTGTGSGLGAKVSEAGGTLTKTYPFGVAIASSDNAAFADTLYNIANIDFVTADVGFDVKQPQEDIEADFGSPPTSGDDDFFFDLQWGHNYVGAVEAWNDGVRGAGVKVAVLDGGFNAHPDLTPNIIHTADMTGQGTAFCPSNPAYFASHAMHVAGTIAAADNAFGTIGVAPEASLVMVKVLRDVPTSSGGCTGSGSFADVIAGIVYATDFGVDVINMSLGASIARQGLGNVNSGLADLQNAVNMAISYAYQNGVTVIVSGGNDGEDLDGGDKGAVRFNTGMSHAVGISALAPENWAGNALAGNGNVPLDPASYTNYGTSMTDFGAPGGDFDYPGNESCTVAGLTRPCWVLDFVFSTGNNGWYWSVGTSMAAPHASGVAALIISETGNSDPAQVIRELRSRATEAGAPGRDDFYGHGITHSGH